MYTFSFFAAIPLGNLAAGWVAERRGLMISLLLLGTGLTVSAIGCAAALATLVSRERTGSLPSTSAGR
jgi:MFS family permease